MFTAKPQRTQRVYTLLLSAERPESNNKPLKKRIVHPIHSLNFLGYLAFKAIIIYHQNGNFFLSAHSTERKIYFLFAPSASLR